MSTGTDTTDVSLLDVAMASGHHHGMVPIKGLEIGRYQRTTLRQYHIDWLAANWDEKKVGVVVVSERDGRRYVIDGYHRVTAAGSLGHKEIYAVTLQGLTEEDEAEIFVDLQVRRLALKPMEVFKGRVYAGDQVANRIYEIAHDLGFTIDLMESAPGPHPATGGHLKAIRSLERIYQQGGEEWFAYTLAIAKAAWPPEDTIAAHGEFLRGLYTFLACEAGLYTTTEVVAKFRKASGGDVLKYANALKILPTRVGLVRSHWAFAFLTVFNKGKKATIEDRITSSGARQIWKTVTPENKPIMPGTGRLGPRGPYGPHKAGESIEQNEA